MGRCARFFSRAFGAPWGVPAISDCINLKNPFTNKMAHLFTAPSDRIMIFVNDTSSVGSFVNVKNGASEIEDLRARDESEINADEYIDTDDSLLFTFETCAMTDDEILSKVTSIEEDEENCQDTDGIEDLIQPPTKYEAMQALEVLQTCTFYDADVGDEMRAKVNAFSKLYDISMTKAKRQKAITDFSVRNEHEL